MGGNMLSDQTQEGPQDKFGHTFTLMIIASMQRWDEL
jgi:hypothetical protein